MYVSQHYMELCMVVYTYNPSIWEVEAGGLWIQGQSGLYSNTLSEQNKMAAGRQWFTFVILATWETEMGRIAVWGQLRQIVLEIPPSAK
jgi:hypothetical protein